MSDQASVSSIPVQRSILSFTSLSEFYVYLTCVFLGISMLMPIQALTSAPMYMVNYYKYVTRDENAEPNSELFWANILTFYNLVSVVTQIICGPTVLLPAARKLSLTLRFVLAISLMMVEVFVVVIMPVGGVTQTAAIIAFVLVTMAAGAGKSYLEATCYALAGGMPPKFMSAVMFGCGFSGVIASTMQCIIKVSMPDTYESVLTQSYIYFSLALVIMSIAMAMSFGLRYSTFAQQYVGEYRMLKGELEEEDRECVRIDTTKPTEPASTDGQVVLSDDDAKSGGNRHEGKTLEVEPTEVQAVQQGDNINSDDEDSVDERYMTTAEQLQHTSAWPIVKLIYPVQAACFCIFFVSLFIFPSLIIPIDRTDKWFATIAILLYNCGDATGRLSSSFQRLWPSRKVLVIVAFCRFAFIPLVFLCIYGIIPGHTAPYIIMPSIGLTKGFFGATSMVFGPNTKGLRTEGQKVMAGQLMGVSLLAGASAAALLAMLVVLFLPQ